MKLNHAMLGVHCLLAGNALPALIASLGVLNFIDPSPHNLGHCLGEVHATHLQTRE